MPDKRIQEANKPVVATADNAAGSLRSGRLFPAVPHFLTFGEMKNMKMQLMAMLGILLLLPIFGGCSGSRDAGISKKIVGTWSSTDSKPEDPITDDETTYFPNGTFNGRAKLKGFIFDKPLIMSGRWYVKDGYLNWTVETSNFTDIFPNGYSSSDKILKISDTEMTYVSSSSGNTKVDRRLR